MLKYRSELFYNQVKRYHWFIYFKSFVYYVP